MKLELSLNNFDRCKKSCPKDFNFFYSGCQESMCRRHIVTGNSYHYYLCLRLKSIWSEINHSTNCFADHS